MANPQNQERTQMPNTKSPSQENPAQTPKKENTILRELTNASILLALVTSLLYISGATYLDSYLSEWGVESSLIINNTQTVLVQGVVILFVGGIYVLSLGVVIGIVLFSNFYMITDISKTPLVRKASSKIYKVLKSKKKEELDPPLILQTITKLSLQLLVFILSLSILWAMFYQLIIFSSSQGEEIAKKEYIEFSENNVTNDKIFTRKKHININGEEKEGYILANSNSLVVLYLLACNDKEEQVVVVPLSSVINIKALKTHNVTTEDQCGQTQSILSKSHNQPLGNK